MFYFNIFKHDVEKWPNILLKSCGFHTTRLLKYVRPFFNIKHEKIKVVLRIDAHSWMDEKLKDKVAPWNGFIPINIKRNNCFQKSVWFPSHFLKQFELVLHTQTPIELLNPHFT